MKLQQTFTHEGKKRMVVGITPWYSSVRFIEYVDYGTPLHKQKRVRVYLSELETGRMGDASNRKTEAVADPALVDSPAISPQLSDKFITIDDAPYLELVKG